MSYCLNWWSRLCDDTIVKRPRSLITDTGSFKEFTQSVGQTTGELLSVCIMIQQVKSDARLALNRGEI